MGATLLKLHPCSPPTHSQDGSSGELLCAGEITLGNTHTLWALRLLSSTHCSCISAGELRVCLAGIHTRKNKSQHEFWWSGALLCQSSPNAKCHRKSSEHNRHKNTSVIFFSSLLQEEKDWVFCLYLVHWKDKCITLIWLNKYLKDTDLIVSSWISIKEIPKMQQSNIKFKSKNIEKSGRVVRFCYSNVIRSARCDETQFIRCYQSKWFWKHSY